jgi:hypothetical protein
MLTIDNFIKIIVKGFSFLLTMILIACSSVQKKDENPSSITALSLSSNIQIVRSDDKQLFEMNDSLTIFYYQGITLYRIFIPVTSSILLNDKNRNVTGEKILKTEIKSQYFIHRKDDVIGYKFDSLNATSFTKLRVDSFLLKKALTSFKKFYNKTNDSLVENIKMPDNIVIEKYIPKLKYDDSYGDSTYLYFSNDLNLKKFEFSFSEEVESIKHMKLFKIRYIYNSVSKENHSLNTPKREFLFELKKTPINDQQKIISFFEKYKKGKQYQQK